MPQATTNVVPCVLFQGQPIRTCLDILRPDLSAVVADNQAQQKQRHNKRSDSCRDFLGSTKWVEGTIDKRVGPVMYLVRLPRGVVWKRHVDHIRDRTVVAGDSSSSGGRGKEPPGVPPDVETDADPDVHVPSESTKTLLVEPSLAPSERSALPIDFLREPIIPLCLYLLLQTELSTPRRNPLQDRRAPVYPQH